MDAAIENLDFDVIIAGGGPVGLVLALGLAQQEAKVLLVEAGAPTPTSSNSFDGRALALAESSKQLLSKLGVWQELHPYLTPIKQVHTSQQGYLGLTLMSAEEMQVEALGHSIRAADLGAILWQKVLENSAIKVISSASLVDYSTTFYPQELYETRGVVAQIKQGEEALEFSARLIVGADGTNSQVRKVMGLPLIEKSYDVFAILAQVTTEKPHCNIAFERFTPEGPVALLPLETHNHKLVFVAPTKQYKDLLALSDAEFIKAFAKKMGYRFGAYTAISPREAYPLKETYVDKVYLNSAVLMGNASHTQHPVAAQGLNLGLRDIADFLDGLAGDLTKLQNEQFFLAYEKSRQADHKKVMQLTDGLIKVFEHSAPLVGHARGLALMGLQVLPSLKRRLAKFSMQGAN